MAGVIVAGALLPVAARAADSAPPAPQDPHGEISLSEGRPEAPTLTTAPEIDAPARVVAGAPFAVTLRARELPAGQTVPVEVRVLVDGDMAGSVLQTELSGPAPLKVTGLVAPDPGTATVEVVVGNVIATQTLGVWTGALSVVPPLLAIALAIAFRQVILALLAGIWAGATLAGGFNPLSAALRVLDRYLLNAFIDPDNASIILFTLLLGGLVAIVSRAGGMQGIVDVARRWADGPRSTQVVTWLMGLFIFFDDYTNTLIVGNTMRPVTDRQRISREKLAYLVDCTAAPIASVALISTWIGFEIGLIGDALEKVGSDLDPYQVFLASIPYRFYPLLALVFAAAVAFSRRDFGPMLAAERRAAGGRVLAETATPMSDFESTHLRAKEGQPHRWVNAAAPIGVVMLVTLVGLWVTGRLSLAAEGSVLGETSSWSVLTGGHFIRDLGTIFSSADSYRTLMWGAGLGCLLAGALAVGQGILSLRETLETWVAGLKAMFLAVMILLLAWAIGDVCDDLNTAGYLVGLVSEAIPWALLSSLVFIIAGAVAFATGTSWATMAILIPLTIPLAREVAALNGFAPADAHALMLGTISSVLAGAVWGDHCSPISDTTIMSSMASGSDHIDHVRTQMPYAVLVGGVALLLGDLPTSLGLSPWLSLLLGAGVLVGFLYLFGRRAEPAG